MSGGFHSAAQFSGSDHRGLVHRLRAVRGELPVRQHQHAPVQCFHRRAGNARAEKSNGEAEGDVLRPLFGFRGAELCLRLPARRGPSREPAKVFCELAEARYEHDAGKLRDLFSGTGTHETLRIDRTHRAWLIASLIIFGVATAIYVVYAAASPAGPSGGSAIGLTFGIAGSLCMIFAGLLAARKKVPVWRLGRAQTWMRGHLWLGLLSLPLILFHGGFRFGGPLTSVLMVLLIIVVASGLFGATLQHYMPNVMTAEVSKETIFEQIDHVRAGLIAETDEMIAATVGSDSSPGTKQSARSAAAIGQTTALAPEAALPLSSFYANEMRPFLQEKGPQNQPLANANTARTVFAELRRLLPPEAHDTVKRFEEICDEERQLRRQARLHHWLHGWLMLHIPLSFALLLLGCVHAVMALRY